MQKAHIYDIQKKGENGQHIYLIPKEKHTHTLIWMHGLGDTADGYLDTFLNPDINPVTLTTKIVLLTAPIRSVTINMGQKMTSWFDFKEFVISDENFEKAVGVDEIRDSGKMITNVMDEELQLLQGDASKLFIGGFSQGACMSLYCGLRYSQKIGGIFVFSGFMFPTIEQHQKNKETKILISHGKADYLLPWARSKETYQKLDEKAHQIKWEIFDNLDHGFCDQSFKAFKAQFLSLIKQ